MKKIVYLKNVDELEQIIGNNLVYLGAGAEGITYLSKKIIKLIKF